MSKHGKRIGRETVYGPMELADLAGVKYETVRTWRARDVTPKPDVVISRVPLWLEATIVRWLQETGRREEA
jgi:hypothetical protein